MIGKIFGGMCVISFIFAAFTGNLAKLGGAAVDGAANAVTLTISLLGMMCLWCGIMNVAKAAGAVEKLSKLLSPVMRPIFPTAYKRGKGTGEICTAVAANMLGIGNAATPLAIKAMEAMYDGDAAVASDDMVVFTVLSTSPVNILPMTLITLRDVCGSANPFEIIVPVWIVSFCCSVFAVLAAKGFCLWKVSRKSSRSRRLQPRSRT
jgi:spore maturation protein A